MKQFGIAYEIYTNDFEGWYPPGGGRANEGQSWIYSPHISYAGASNVTSGSASPTQIRQGLLWPYLKNYEVYRCPGDKNREIRGYSYSQNAAYQAKNKGQIERWIGQVVLMVEEQRPDDGCFWYQNAGAVDTRDCLSYDRHVTCTNLLFGDGHAKGISFKKANAVLKLRDIGAFPGEEDRW